MEITFARASAFAEIIQLLSTQESTINALTKTLQSDDKNYAIG